MNDDHMPILDVRTVSLRAIDVDDDGNEHEGEQLGVGWVVALDGQPITAAFLTEPEAMAVAERLGARDVD